MRIHFLCKVERGTIHQRDFEEFLQLQYGLQHENTLHFQWAIRWYAKLVHISEELRSHKDFFKINPRLAKLLNTKLTIRYVRNWWSLFSIYRTFWTKMTSNWTECKCATIKKTIYGVSHYNTRYSHTKTWIWVGSHCVYWNFSFIWPTQWNSFPKSGHCLTSHNKTNWWTVQYSGLS